MAKLVAHGIKIPPQPKVLVELQNKLLKGDADIRALARVVGTDPGISAMLFKAVRSPAFGRGKKCDSLQQVIAVLGVKQTFNLAQAVAVATTLSNSTQRALDIFWTRSSEVAQLAALISKDRVSICNVFPDQAYQAALFHECGVPVLMQRFPDYCRALRFEQRSSWPKLAEEDARFNVDHGSIGYLVARHWKLPDFICTAIQYHHEMPSDEVGTSRTLVAILHLAIHFHHRVSGAAYPYWGSLRDRVLGEIGLHPDAEDEYFEEISEQFHGS